MKIREEIKQRFKNRKKINETKNFFWDKVDKTLAKLIKKMTGFKKQNDKL